MTNLNLTAYRNWAHKWRAELLPMFSPTDVPTVKALLFLALLETQGNDCGYDDLTALIEYHGVVASRGDLKRDGLRVAIGDLHKTLANHQTPFRLVRRGQGVFCLNHAHLPAVATAYSQVITDFSLNHPLGKPEELLRNLFETRVLPFHSLYYLPQSAAWWANYSHEEAAKRHPLEAASWRCFGLHQRLQSTDRILSVVGLAVGEGRGELAMLQEIIKDLDPRVQVHYLAIDLSPGLLLHHAQNLSLEFRHLMSAGRMVCATVVGDIYDLLPSRAADSWDAISRARDLMFPEFLPWQSPMLVTYLGNCMGNEAPDSERRFFDLLRTRLGDKARAAHDDPSGPLECVIGVSVNREPEKYTLDWENFLLEGPRRLLERGLLRSHGSGRGAFVPKSGGPETQAVDYSASLGLTGRRYVFNHVLQHSISASTGTTALMPDRLNEKQAIQLYAITKYDMETMVTLAGDLGFHVARVDAARVEECAPNFAHPVEDREQWLEQIVHTKNGTRHYGVFGVGLGQ